MVNRKLLLCLVEHLNFYVKMISIIDPSCSHIPRFDLLLASNNDDDDEKKKNQIISRTRHRCLFRFSSNCNFMKSD